MGLWNTFAMWARKGSEPEKKEEPPVLYYTDAVINFTDGTSQELTLNDATYSNGMLFNSVWLRRDGTWYLLKKVDEGELSDK